MKAEKILTGLVLMAVASSAWSQTAPNDVKAQVMTLEKAAQKSHGFSSATIPAACLSNPKKQDNVKMT